MNSKPEKRSRIQSDRALRRTGFAGLIAGAAALLACELPLVLAAVGMGGLGVAALQLPPIVETGGLIAAGFGAGLLLFVFIRRSRARKKDPT